MTNVIIGVPGGGKTRKAMEIVEEKLRDGVRWDQILFSSFSRAACSEAAMRAAKVTGVEADRLQKDGWFRTVHSCAFRLLGIDGKLLIDHDKDSGRKFVEETLGAARGGPNGTLADKVDKALEKWDSNRSRLNRFRPEKLPDLSDLPNVGPGDQYRPVSGQAPPGHCPSNKNTGFSCAGHSVSYYGTDIENENQHYLCGRPTGPTGLNHSDPYIEHWKKNGQVVPGLVVSRPGHLADEEFRIIRKYEQAKRYSGQYDFTDILLRYAGVEVDDDLMFRECYPLGSVPSEIELAIFDEYQDSSELLHRVAQRLSGFAGEAWMVGDTYQAIYGFAASDHRILRREEREAIKSGNRVLLNRSWRNPPDVVRWAEEILEEDPEYVSRGTWTEVQGGSVGLVKQYEFMSGLADFAGSDCLILARTWFGLGAVKKRLEELNIPWVSCSDQEHSHWDSPVKIAIVITMRDLIEGRMISEQDWRRLTENFNMKSEGLELFRKGEKTKWKKMECSGRLSKTIWQLEDWGAGEGFVEFVQKELWRKNQFLLLDVAIEKWGLELVRSPKIRLGTCHSAKGMESDYVFCMSQSSELANQSAFEEDLFLKYVTVTRTKRHYRVVVDEVARSKGKPLFLACPKGSIEWRGMPDAGEGDPIEDCAVDQQTARDVRDQNSCDSLQSGGDPGLDLLREGEIRRDGSETSRGNNDTDSATADSEDNFSEWDSWNRS